MAIFFTVGANRSHNRKDRRFDAPRLKLSLGGQTFETFDWSLGGFRITDFKGRPPVGEVLRVTELSYANDYKASVNCQATVTRVILGKNQVAFSFKELDENAFEFLEAASLRRLNMLANK